MKHKPLVSVIIPVYNAEKTVGAILHTLLEQPYKNVEIIAVNDGSQDGSIAVLRKYAEGDMRVKVIDQTNAGASQARNAGIDGASGEYIMFVDSDDNVSDDIVVKLVNEVRENLDLVICGMSINGVPVSAPDKSIIGKQDVALYVLDSLLTKNLLYGPCCKLFRLSIIVEKNIRFHKGINYGEDTIFVLEYLSFVRGIANINLKLYYYNFQASGLASSYATRLSFRSARAKALNGYLSDVNLNATLVIKYIILRSRWGLSLLKAVSKKAVERHV